jgi:hypothetical protein
MDYGYVLRRAWEITWRWKVLWIFGFLAGLARATSGGNPSYSFDSSQWGGTRGFELPPEFAGILAGVCCLVGDRDCSDGRTDLRRSLGRR